MQYTLSDAAPEQAQRDSIVVGVYESGLLSAAAQRVDQAANGAAARIVERGDFIGKKGDALLCHDVPGIAAPRLLLIGLGEKEKFDDRAWREAAGAAANALAKTGAVSALFCLPDDCSDDDAIYRRVRHGVESVAAALYRFEQCKEKSREKRPPQLNEIAFALPDANDHAEAERGLREGQAVANGVALACDLGNLPGNRCTPTDLVAQARELARDANGAIEVSVLDQEAMERAGFGALLAVARGSREPPYLIALDYRGAPERTQPPIALVGKGVTFDSGGISLKPGARMDEMKYDMCGAASVLGALRAACDLALPINLVGVIPTVENMPGGDAVKPGDIVTSLSGQTVEILNTDAEGRLILCDALTWVAEQFKPTEMVDIATLTGACVVALGAHASGLMANDDALADALLAAGERSGDRAWRLPLWEEYQRQIDSPFADMQNIGDRKAGVITAGCFLSRFVEKQRWAHLDIAGTAWKEGKEKGATGRPVGLLLQYLLDRAAQGAGAADADRST